MARTIIGVIVGYVLMFLLNIAGYLTMYAVMGQEQAFKPRLYLASNRWIAVAFVMIFITAIIAGVICAVIAKGGRAPLALAIATIVIGLLLAIPATLKARINSTMVRTGDVPSMQAMSYSYWPLWCPFTFPFVSAIGVIIGGKVKRS